MRYMKLNDGEREELLSSLASMSQTLKTSLEDLGVHAARTPGPDGAFSPVEQVWHLADLEREGFGLRIGRLRSESNPHLPDFDGAAVAAQRNYRCLSLLDGLRAFESARNANLEVLHSLAEEAWLRSGTQDGVGSVSLCDIPMLMLQHDQAHLAEIEQWTRHTYPGIA